MERYMQNGTDKLLMHALYDLTKGYASFCT